MKFLNGFCVSDTIAEFIGNNEVIKVTSGGVTFKDGEFKKFPEMAVELPIPEWVHTLGPDVSNAWTESEWELLSFAKKKIKTFVAGFQPEIKQNKCKHSIVKMEERELFDSISGVSCFRQFYCADCGKILGESWTG
jgi:hypothetical protein